MSAVTCPICERSDQIVILPRFNPGRPKTFAAECDRCDQFIRYVSKSAAGAARESKTRAKA